MTWSSMKAWSDGWCGRTGLRNEQDAAHRFAIGELAMGLGGLAERQGFPHDRLDAGLVHEPKDLFELVARRALHAVQFPLLDDQEAEIDLDRRAVKLTDHRATSAGRQAAQRAVEGR